MFDVPIFSKRALPLLAAVLLPIPTLSAKQLADYQIGDKADQDILAPTRLSIVDQDGTEALKQKTADRVPLVVRFDTNAPDKLEERFRAIFSQTQQSFLDMVGKSFGHNKLSDEESSSTNFHSLEIKFQEQNRLFPVSTNLAALWASGDAGQSYEATLVAALRQAVSVVIRPDLPGGMTFPSTMRVVSMGDTNAPLTGDQAERTGKNTPRKGLVALADLKKNFQSAFPPEERDVAEYLATLLTPNTVVDLDLTLQLRDKHTQGLWVVDNYEAGQVIVYKGQAIDRKTMAAIDQVREKTVVTQMQDLQTKQQATVGQLAQLVADNKSNTTQNRSHIRWLIGGLTAGVFILSLAIWQLARRRPAVSLVPVPAGGAVEQWQQRALTAEQNAEMLQSAARSGLVAHLSKSLSSTYTQTLLSQRRDLLDVQNKAAAEMMEFEARLEKIHAPIKDRLAAYEARIAELEKELTARGQENRELLNVKIEMMRQLLEAQRDKNRAQLQTSAVQSPAGIQRSPDQFPGPKSSEIRSGSREKS